MTTDRELLRQYATTGDETAFAELVRRQVNLVYTVALRVANGNEALAEDVAQSVFMDLARKATPLSHHEALAGWLHTSARFAALKAVRSEQRRQTYEREAIMHEHLTTAEFDWEKLRPVLDEAVGRLREKDRAAVVLRFFQGLSHREVGEALGLNENTARKRVDHALEKMRAHFARAGITISSALLASTLSAHSLEAAPFGLADKITQPSLAGAAGGGTLASALMTVFLMSTKTKVAFLALIAVAAVIAVVAITHTPPDKPAPAATAPASIATTTKAPAPANVVAAPVARPSAPPATILAATAPTAAPAPTAGTATAPTGDPQAEISSAVDDIIRLLRASEILAFYENYTAPADKAKWAASQRDEYARQDAMVKANPTGDGRTQSLIDAFESIKGQTPKMNAAGDEATFQFTMIPPPGIDAPPKTAPMVMVKVDGKWYLKNF